jgi:outer membrane scaffolding protein for murein synthesis (MipA/OmpV family)
VDEHRKKVMYMKKVLISLVFIAALCPTAMSAQENDLCFWNAISMKKAVAEKWTVGVRAEHRANNDASTTQQYYLRPMVDYKILPWMTATAQADFAWMSTGFNIRVMPQVVFSHKVNGFDLSLRQRLQATWKQPDNSWNFLFRTKAQVRYKIPQIPLSPLVAVEPYYMSDFVRTRYYFGVSVACTKSLSILLQYVYQDQYQRAYDDNVLWLTFNVKL